jgi:mono/diheme cytochrome c family protein
MRLRLIAVCLLFLRFASAQENDRTEGKRLFIAYQCYACHGFSGQNGPGRRLVPMRFTQTAFTAYVRKPGTRAMPTYSGAVITDQKLADLWSYIQTLPVSAPPDGIPLLQQIRAEAGK